MVGKEGVEEGEARNEGKKGSKATLIFYPLLLRITFWVMAVCLGACVCVCMKGEN